MISTATIEELTKCATLAEEFYAKNNQPGGFSRDAFLSWWKFAINNGHGMVFVRSRGEVPLEAIGVVFSPDTYDGQIVAASMFWYISDEPVGLAGGILFRFVEDQVRKRGAKRFYVPALLDSRMGLVSGFLVNSGFKPTDLTYRKEY